VRVVERVPLEPRRTLYLLEAGEKFLLVGATDHEIRVLAEFPRDQLPAPPAPEHKSFLDVLRSVGRKPGVPS
jgi:flagellar biogenesis protein FliO